MQREPYQVVKRVKTAAFIINLAERLKPALTRLIPIKILRRVKKSIVDSSMMKLASAGNRNAFTRTAFIDGVNLIGYIRGEIGLGESCRLVARGLAETGLDFTIYNYEQVSAMRHSDFSWEYKITNTTPYNINLIHIQPYELPLAYLRINEDIWSNRYNIAFWLWELEEFPEQWQNAFSLVDEIWTPSEFASESIRKATNKPVYTVPYALQTPDCGEYGRRDFDLPEDKFLFLCMYDCSSFFERKNPIAAINAYKQAFPPDEKNVGIVIKLNNPQKKDMQLIREKLADYSNVYFVAEVLDRVKANALIACTDAYVSLHRSEGFSLIPAEAMFLGTPVIATNWSANTEFMSEDTGCLVDYVFINIEKDYGPYLAGNRWAEPVIEQASGYMRKLYEDRDYHQLIASNARLRISEKLAPEHMAALIRKRISAIYSKADAVESKVLQLG